MSIAIGRHKVIKTLSRYKKRLEAIFPPENIDYDGVFCFINLKSVNRIDCANTLKTQGIPHDYYPTDLAEEIRYTRFTDEGELDVSSTLLADYILFPGDLINMAPADIVAKVAQHHQSVNEPSWDDQYSNGNLYSVKQFME